MKTEYILVLPSWYPSKLDEFNGDFNERLVHAVSNYKNQIVVYVSTKKKSTLKEIEIFEKANVITYRAYFLYSKFNVINVFRMFKLHLRIFEIIFKKHGLPLLVHNYVFFPSGLISFYLKHRYKLKIILTEHSSLFNYTNNSNNNIYKEPYYLKILYSIILKSFDATISVSKSLDLSISEWTKKIPRFILPNVVDVDFFNRNGEKKFNKVFNYIHVSNIGNHKNVEGILKVFTKVLESGTLANLTLIGTEKETILSIINNNDLLKKNVIFLGELSYKEVSQHMKAAHAFVLFSRYENMPCVILEALCCGLPIVSSNVGGIATVVNETNGLLVESENEEELEKAIVMMIKKYHHYNLQTISENAISAFNYDHIGKKTNDIYLEILS